MVLRPSCSLKRVLAQAQLSALDAEPVAKAKLDAYTNSNRRWSACQYIALADRCLILYHKYIIILQAREEVLAQLLALDAEAEAEAAPPPDFYYVSASWLGFVPANPAHGRTFHPEKSAFASASLSPTVCPTSTTSPPRGSGAGYKPMQNLAEANAKQLQVRSVCTEGAPHML